MLSPIDMPVCVRLLPEMLSCTFLFERRSPTLDCQTTPKSESAEALEFRWSMSVAVRMLKLPQLQSLLSACSLSVVREVHATLGWKA